MTTTSRRSILAGVAALPALAAGVAAANAETSAHSRLPELWADREAARHALALADAAEDAAQQRYRSMKIELPDDMKLFGSDLIGLPFDRSMVHRLKDGRCWFDREGWREIVARMESEGQPSRAMTKARRGLAAAEQYEREIEAASGASGASAAAEDACSAYDRCCEIEDAIMAAPVTCAGDLAIKARLVGWHLDQKGMEPPDAYVPRLVADAEALARM